MFARFHHTGSVSGYKRFDVKLKSRTKKTSKIEIANCLSQHAQLPLAEIPDWGVPGAHREILVHGYGRNAEVF